MPIMLDYDDVALLSMMIYGEARGEPIQGQIGVACCARNRVDNKIITWWGTDWKEVLLQPYQFSCFNSDDPNLIKMIEAWRNREQNDLMKQAYWIAQGVMSYKIMDNTKGSNHYYSIGIMPPKWAIGHEQKVRIGNHRFYKL